MAYWGIALTHWGNPFAGLRSPQAIAAGKAAIEKGQATGSPTPREKGYIDAVAGLFSSADPGTQRARVLAYEKATEAVAAQNPADIEARIFWALAIAQTALPTDKSFAQNLRAAEILEPLYKKMPNHPGLAHYIIHTYDVPALADKALPAARAYADIAPAVPHALHMPSHTFTRVGLWKESVATNIKSAAEAEKTGGIGEALHALDYQTYAYLQMAQDAQAKAVLDHAVKANAAAPNSPGPPAAAPTRLRSRPFPRGTRWSASSGPTRWRSPCGRRRTRRTPRRSHTSRARSARLEPESPPRPRRISPGSARFTIASWK